MRDIFQFSISQRIDWADWAVFIYAKNQIGIVTLSPVEFTQHEGTPDDPPSPTLSLNKESLQNLADELWNAGFRPTQKIDESSRIEAVSYHLEDMRRIVFDGLKLTSGIEKENKDSGDVDE